MDMRLTDSMHHKDLRTRRSFAKQVLIPAALGRLPAQQDAPARFDSQSPADLARKSSAVDRLLAPWSSATGPGASIVVIDHGRLVHRKGYGLADREKKRPFLPNTPSLIGS